jgi:hypothetical protein
VELWRGPRRHSRPRASSPPKEPAEGLRLSYGASKYLFAARFDPERDRRSVKVRSRTLKGGRRRGILQGRGAADELDGEAMTNEDIRRAVEEVAADALREGRGYLRLVEWGVELTPQNPSACPVSFAVQSEEEVSLFVGRYSTTVDIYDPDPSSLLVTLKEYVTAIIEGRSRRKCDSRRPLRTSSGRREACFTLIAATKSIVTRTSNPGAGVGRGSDLGTTRTSSAQGGAAQQTACSVPPLGHAGDTSNSSSGL